MNKYIKSLIVIFSLRNFIFQVKKMVEQRNYLKKIFVMLSSMLFSMLLVSNSMAYNVDANIIMTKEAAKRSVLSDESLWQEWGIESGSATLLPAERFMPMSRTEWRAHLDPTIEGDRNGIMRVGARLPYPELMAFGADIEESELDAAATLPLNIVSALSDLVSVLQKLLGKAKSSAQGIALEILLSQLLGSAQIPQDFGASRTYNHYFNPQADEKLSVFMVDTILRADTYTSPDWILEDRQAISAQRFSYVDAMAHFYTSQTAFSKYDREEALGRTIHTLGHIVHHIQDMSLPQHTRIDFHCDTPECIMLNYVTFGDATYSVYESFIEELVRCSAFDYPNEAPRSLGCVSNRQENFVEWYSIYDAESVQLNTYPVVDTAILAGTNNLDNFTPRQFWTNARGAGIADFSSENFITTDTAFSFGLTCAYCDLDLGTLGPHSDELPLPNGVPSDVSPEGVYLGDRVRLADLISPQFANRLPQSFLQADIQFVGKATHDAYTNQVIHNDRMASFSVFQERLDKKFVFANANVNRRRTAPPRFTTNYFNYSEQMKLLMPRAVGYSAGLINHFFGHRFSLTYDEDQLQITLTNTGKYDLDGRLEFYYDNNIGDVRRGLLGFINHNGEINLPVGHSITIDIIPEDYPEDASGEFVLVYIGHGDVSLENSGVAGSTVFIAEPNLCSDSEMALWVANENEALDDNFNLFINNRRIGGLDLGDHSCNGHMYFDANKYSNLNKNDIDFHPEVSVGSCLDNWRTDSSSNIYFSTNMPKTMEFTSYSIFMDNIQNNNNSNQGDIYAFQVCDRDNSNRPIIRRVLTSDEYVMQSGQDYTGNFTTGACLPCD